MFKLMDIANILDDSGIIPLSDIKLGHMITREKKKLGIYSNNNSGEPTPIPFGGESNNDYDIQKVKLMLRWDENFSDGEAKAKEIYDYFRNNSTNLLTQDGDLIYLIKCLRPNPVFIGRDDDQNFEWVIPYEIQIERRN